MSMPPDLILVARQWIEKAEKYIKALLISNTIEFPKTHDLRMLIQLVPEKIQLGLDLKGLLGLNRYAIEARYPGNFEPIMREEAEEALETAKAVRSAVRSNLSEKIIEE